MLFRTVYHSPYLFPWRPKKGNSVSMETILPLFLVSILASSIRPSSSDEGFPQIPLLLSPREFHVSRDTPVGTKVVQIKVMSGYGDKYTGEVKYGLRPGQHYDLHEYFQVNETTGAISLKKAITSSVKSPGSITVTAIRAKNGTEVGTQRSSFVMKIDIENSGEGETEDNAVLPPFLPPYSIFSSTTWRTTSTASSSTASNTSTAKTTKTTVPKTASTPIPMRPSSELPTTISPISVSMEVTTVKELEEQENVQANDGTFIMVTIAVIFVLVLILGLIYFCLRFNTNTRQLPLVLTKRNTNKSMSKNAYDEEPKPSAPSKEKDDPFAIPRHHLRILHLLGEGFFGQVYKAELLDHGIVAVKTLKSDAGDREKSDLLSELEVLKDIGKGHANVVAFIGACISENNSEPPFIVLEYIGLGKLQSFLRQSRGSPYSNTHSGSMTLTSRDLTSYAYQVAKGMDFLSKKGIVHRDLAARNVLIDSDKITCKVVDFGFARDVGDNGGVYERKAAEGVRLPIRWMPPEALYDSMFTTKSDVWSFGILMWEIVTLGCTPYPGLLPSAVMRKVRDGYRLEKPEHCKRELYNIMYYCWNGEPEKRPSFEELVKFLGDLMEEENGEEYLRLDLFPDHDYYNVSVVNEEGGEDQGDGIEEKV